MGEEQWKQIASMKAEEKNEAGSSSEIYCYCLCWEKKLKLRESC